MDLGCSHVCTATMTLTLFGLEDNGLYQLSYHQYKFTYFSNNLASTLNLCLYKSLIRSLLRSLYSSTVSEWLQELPQTTVSSTTTPPWNAPTANTANTSDAILEVSDTATTQQIRDAYKRYV